MVPVKSALRLIRAVPSKGEGVGKARGATRESASANSIGVVIAAPLRPCRWNRAWQMIESMVAGTPADTWRGLQGAPSITGAGGSGVASGPGQ